MEKDKRNQRVMSVESATILKELYNSKYSLQEENGNELVVSVQGSINLLASGYKGLIALRQVRQQLGYVSTNELIFEKHQNGDSKEPK